MGDFDVDGVTMRNIKSVFTTMTPNDKECFVHATDSIGYWHDGRKPEPTFGIFRGSLKKSKPIPARFPAR